MDFSKTLKQLIKKKGITTKSLAASVSISPKTISDWLAGTTPRDFEGIKRCAEYFDVSVHFLLYGSEDENVEIALSTKRQELQCRCGLYEVIIRKTKGQKP